MTPVPFYSDREAIAQILNADALPGVGLADASKQAARQFRIVGAFGLSRVKLRAIIFLHYKLYGFVPCSETNPREESS